MEQHSFNKNFSGFRENLDLTNQDKKSLTDARKIIRSTIRTTFNEMPERYFINESRDVLASFAKNPDKKIKPKFMTQGSFAYKTINKPANSPIQQIDLDDGVYLPLSYVEDKSNDSFEQASELVRGIVFHCVKDLCDSDSASWKLESRSKCLRIIINKTSHIDLPIYSIPDNELTTIRDENHAFAETDGMERFLSYNKVENVLLATNDGWIKSDPRVIQEWVKNTKDKFRDFIYYSRYLKAWKDHQWNDSKFSSIMIMAGIAQALSEDSYPKNNSVALNLSAIATSLKLYISNGGIKDPDNSKRLDTDERLPNRSEVISKLNTLAINLNKAITTNNHQLLIECFGDRFPENISNQSAPVIVTNIKNEPKPWLPY